MVYIRDETTTYMHGKLYVHKDSAMTSTSTVAN